MEDDITKIGDYDIDTSQELGGGTYGTVFKGTNRKTLEPVAAKMIPLFKAELRESAARKLEILNKVHYIFTYSSSNDGCINII